MIRLCTEPHASVRARERRASRPLGETSSHSGSLRRGLRLRLATLGLFLLLVSPVASVARAQGGSCVDNDGDGYGVNGHVTCPQSGIDCDDADGSINPGVDDDGDGFDVCVDCDDTDADINPGVDDDGDGFDVCVDCDDTDADINPGVDDDDDGEDVCTDCDDTDDGIGGGLGVDNDGDGFDACVDCNDFDPSVAVDGDGDGFSACVDCDDTDADINPGVDADGDGFNVCVDCDDTDSLIGGGCGPAPLPVLAAWSRPLLVAILLIAACTLISHGATRRRSRPHG